MKRDPWAVPAAVYVPELTATPDAVHAVWAGGGTTVECTLVREGVAVAVKAIEVVSESGSISRWARKIPSDGQIVGSVRSFGEEGISAIAILLGQTDQMSKAYQETLARFERQGRDPALMTQAARDFAVNKYGKQLPKRPSAGIQNEVNEVRQLLADGARTRDVVNQLRARGLSESTAYRRLKEARDG